jgi:putative SOS response-associated peptidase YedK
MCGRFTLRTPAADLAEIFRALDPPDIRPRYNIAPTQAILAVKLNEEQQREFDLLHWGLVPSWADDPKIGNRMINCQGETARTKPSFRSAFKTRRCLIVADGFYEWKVEGKAKQPLLIGRRDGGPFAFAGLWERWSKGETTLKSCTIITTEPNELMQSIHNRMPVILSPQAYDQWLTGDPEEAEQLLRPCSPVEFHAVPVSTKVNNPRNDSPDCIVALP